MMSSSGFRDFMELKSMNSGEVLQMEDKANGAGLTATSTELDDTQEKVSEVPSSDSSPETKTTGTEGASTTPKEESEASVTAEADELAEFLPKNEEAEKNNVQKRIDKLTAQIKQLREENEELKTTVSKPTDEKKKTKYTMEQLKGALQKARAEGDIDLEMDVLAYMKESTKDEIIDMYQGEQSRVSEAQKQIAEEWHDVLRRYDYLAAEKQPELYPGSKKDLNLKDQKSLLFRLASALFTDPQTAQEYRYKGGQRQAVADALTQILRKRTNPSETSETLKLKKQLDKERMKNSFGSTDAEADSAGEGTVTAPVSKIDAYIQEQKTLKAKRNPGTGLV
jgi:hypothetical protein